LFCGCKDKKIFLFAQSLTQN